MLFINVTSTVLIRRGEVEGGECKGGEIEGGEVGVGKAPIVCSVEAKKLRPTLPYKIFCVQHVNNTLNSLCFEAMHQVLVCHSSTNVNFKVVNLLVWVALAHVDAVSDNAIVII